jgi:hypothetical protein
VGSHNYQAYGLNIHSTIELPELRPAGFSEPADLLIQSGAVAAPPLGERASGLVWTPAGDACLAFRDAGAFLVRSGREITADQAPRAGESVLRLYLLGPVLAVALYQRGWLILHASAVAIDGRVAAFLGGSGWGKSTLAASLQQRGHPLVADDFIAVPIGAQAGAELRVYPGFPQLKLWPAAAASLGADVEQLPRLHPDFDKRAQRLSAGFAQVALPLERLYVLAEGEPAGIQPLDKQGALVELVRHSYMSQSLPGNDAAGHLRQCAALLSGVGLSRLQRPLSLTDLPAVSQMVETDLAGVPPGPVPAPLPKLSAKARPTRRT